MKQSIIFIILLIGFKANSQVQYIPIVKVNLPKEIYENSTRKFLSISNNDDSTIFYNKHYSFSMTDFDLKNNKHVKNMSIDMNSDKTEDYYYEFDGEGKITFINDFVRQNIHTYKYSRNLITITKHYKNSKSTEVDSIYFDDKKNIIKQSYTAHQSDKTNEIYDLYAVEYKYSETNKLIKKYSYNHGNKDILNTVNLYSYEYLSDSIIEKRFSVNNINKKDLYNPNIFNNKYKRKIYYLDKNNNIYKINTAVNNDPSENYYTLKYDKSGRIIELINNISEGWNSYFKFNNFGNISEIKMENGVYLYKYDDHNYHTSEQIKESKTLLKDYSYIYDKNSNWIKRIENTSNNAQIFLSRKINYY